MPKYFIAIAAFIFAAPALAQQADNDRMARAVPSLIQQRDAAMNNLALCDGDTAALNGKVKDLQSKLDAANKQIEDLKKPPAETP